MNIDPYTKKERRAFDALMKAHDLFIQLPVTHPSEQTIWIEAIHQQQMLFGMRVLRRDYPNEFVTIEEV